MCLKPETFISRSEKVKARLGSKDPTIPNQGCRDDKWGIKSDYKAAGGE